MSAFYEAVGRLVVGYIRQRYGAQIRNALLALLAAVLLGAFLAARGRGEESD
jgi:hypothetical protein